MRAFSVLAVLAICATCAVQCVPLDKKLEDSDINSIVSTERTERVSKDGQDEPTDEDFSLVPRERDEICETDCIAGNSEEDSEESSEARALGRQSKKKKKKQQDLMSRILPMMVIPFMIQTAMIPMVLTSLKFMLLKSAFIGKLAIILGILNALRRQQNGGAVYSHNVNFKEDTEKLHREHYGYYGAPEYGAWINR